MATDARPDDERADGRRRRPALLAGVLVGTAGTLDVLGYLSQRSIDPYVDMTGGGMAVLNTTGWARLHVVVGALVVVTGLAIATGRVPLVLAGLAVVAAAVTTDVLFLPFDPMHGMLAVGLHVSAVVVLLRNRRLLTAPG
ncbi:hypothetical protein ACFO0M_03240 [Micromonospora mangrovi]|uniref:DUF7144 domain-containing protein n=2 Tax=Micromonospora TaxID=1873 RepID=A0AAU7M2X3_9ACTN